MRFLITLILFASTAFTQSIPCDANLYVSRYLPLTNVTQVVQVRQSPYTETLLATMPTVLDVLAYNPVDGMLYGLSADNRLIEIDNAGAFIIHGTIAGLPSTTWAGGTFDDAGNLWAIPVNGATLYRIQLDSRIATTLPIGTINNAGDIVFSQNAFWVIASDALYRITTTGVTTSTPVAVNGYEAMFVDGNNVLYVYGGGRFDTINPTGTITPIATVPASVRTDGASCPYFAPVVRPIVNLSETVSYNSFPSPGMDMVYRTHFSNNGTQPARDLTITVAVGESTDFKLNSVYVAAPPGVQFTIAYSRNFNRRNPNPITAAEVADWTYLPVSRGGRALEGYDRNVKAIQIKTSTPFTYLWPHNEGFMTFTAQIQ